MKRPESNTIRSYIPDSVIQAASKSRAARQDALRQALANFRANMVRELSGHVADGTLSRYSLLGHLDAEGLGREVELSEPEKQIPKQ